MVERPKLNAESVFSNAITQPESNRRYVGFLEQFSFAHGLRPEYILNMELFSQSGILPLVIAGARQANDYLSYALDKLGFDEPEQKEYGDFCDNLLKGFSEASAAFAVSHKKAAQSVTSLRQEQESMNKNMNPKIYFHDIQVAEETKDPYSLAIYRQVTSMAMTLFNFFTAEGPSVQSAFRESPETYLSTLAYIAFEVEKAIGEKYHPSGNDYKPLLFNYLIEDGVKVFSNVYFACEYAETYPSADDNQKEIAHLLSTHSLLLGLLGDRIMMHILPNSIHDFPVGLHTSLKNQHLRTLLDGSPDSILDMLQLNSDMPLLFLLNLAYPTFVNQIKEMIAEDKIAIHASFKNSLSIFIKTPTGDFEGETLLDQLKNTKSPKGFVVSTATVQSTLLHQKISSPQGLQAALDPKIYDRDDLYRFRFFVDPSHFDSLMRCLSQDSKEPYVLFVDSTNKTRKVNVSDSSFSQNFLAMIEEQYRKGGRAIVFAYTNVSIREGVDSPPESASHFPIEIQIIPMNMMKQFYEQRANFIEARLMGKEGENN